MNYLFICKHYFPMYFTFTIFLCTSVSCFHDNLAESNLKSNVEMITLTDHINITGLILARGGSKGIPMKNLASFKGQTLLRRAIMTMKKFGRFSSIWVSTDNIEIAKEAESSGAFVHFRSAESASDTASSLMAIQEFCKNKPGISYIGLVQCTSPFLAPSYLHEAYNLLLGGYDSVFSGTREHKLRWKQLTDGEIVPLNFDRRCRPRRQDWEGDLVENGMFYFMNIALVNFGLLQGGRIGSVEVSKLHSIEIDNPMDLIIAGIIFDTHLSRM